MPLRISLLFLLISLSVYSVCAADLYPPMKPPFADIIRNGKALCVIVPKDNAGEAGAWAAQHVKTYLGKISDADLPIAAAPEPNIFTISIQLDPVLGDEEFRIRCDGKGELVLAGGGPRGIAYSACAFLEECLGVRWFMPTECGAVVPRATTVRLGIIDRTEHPDFALRWIGHDADWAVHNRLNVSIPISPVKIALPGHSFDATIPRDKYFTAHPDWFAYQRETKRRRPTQLCTSNPDLVKEVVKNLRVRLDADPDIRVIGLCPNDGAGFCECDQCMALDEPGHPTVVDVNTRYVQLNEDRRTALSRRFLMFFNDVARGLAETHPKVIIRSFVYNAYLAPPTDPALRCEPNVMAQICHNTCHNHPFGSDPCPANARFREYVQGWARICEHIGFYEYYGKGASMELPWPMVHCMRKDIPYLHDQGASGFYTQWGARYMAPAGLNFYVAAKLLWNSRTDVDVLLDDFYAKFYGPAAEPMGRIFSRLEDHVARSPLHAKGSSDTQYQFVRDWFAAEVLDPCLTDIAEAKKLTADPDILRRITVQESVLTYAKLMREYGDEIQRLHEAGVTNDKEALSEALRRAALVEEFVKQHRKDGLALSKYTKGYLNPKTALTRLRAPLANPW